MKQVPVLYIYRKTSCISALVYLIYLNKSEEDIGICISKSLPFKCLISSSLSLTEKNKIVEIPDGVGPEVGFSFRIYHVKHSDDSD